MRAPEESSFRLDTLARPEPDVGVDPTGLPVTVSVSSTFVARSLDVFGDDESGANLGRAPRSPYLELRGDVRRELAAHRAWGVVSALSRLREGPASGGGRATLDVLPAGLSPGLHVTALAMTQSTRQGESTYGLGSVVQTYASIALSKAVRVVPWVSFAIQRTDRAIRTTEGADPDVYTPYAFLHPRYATAAVRLAARPFIDTIGRAEVSVRSSPDLDGVDRAEARLDADTLPGAGFAPWLGASFASSYRPLTATRDQGFVRNTASLRATFWWWLARGHRVSLEASLSVLYDAPSAVESSPPFAGAIGLAYDYTSNRGVRDFAPRLALFRDRLEEGSGRVQRVERPANAGWSAP